MSLHISLPCAVVSSKLQIRCATPSWMACLCRQPGKTALLQRCAESPMIGGSGPKPARYFCSHALVNLRGGRVRMVLPSPDP